MLIVSWHDEEGSREAHVFSTFSRLGRSSEADIRINSASVSRRHAMLSKSDRGWTLRDLGSQNGMQVNGCLVREHVLQDGSIVSLGNVPLRFVFAVHDSVRLTKGSSKDDGSSFRREHPDSVSIPASKLTGEGMLAERTDGSGALTEGAKALGRLAAVAKALISTSCQQTLFQRVVDAVLESTPVDHVFLLLHDAGGNQLVPKAGTSRDGRAGDVPISQTIASHVFRRREAILTLDATSDSRFDGGSIVAKKIRSVMCAPLLVQDGTQGVLFASTTKGRVALREHHLHLLTVIASLAAAAIEQAQLRERMEGELLIRSRLTRYHSPTLVDQLLAEGSRRDTMPPAERDVSVLFADIVGFSTRTERMAPADVSRLLNGVFSELVEVVFAHGGTLDKFLGDGLMAIFGAPNDLPDHACRAVECAIEMQERVQKLDIRDGTGEPVCLRIGVNSGLVVAGDLGSERRVEYTVLGNAVNVAARLEAFVAQPGETVIGETTWRSLGQRIRTEALGPQTLKGIREAVPAFRVLP